MALILTIYFCAHFASRNESPEAPLPNYSLDTSQVRHTKQVYVPVHFVGKTKSGLPATRASLKIRNTSFADSMYISRVAYYDTHGTLLKNFVDSVWLVKPMATAEVTVRSNEFKTTGDNFVVQWHSKDSLHQPIVQVVSLDRNNQVVTTDHGIIIDNRAGVQ